VGRVVRLSIAPVKALGLVHPEHVDLGLGGVAGDRRFWLVDEDGRLFNDKRHGPLVRIRPEWDEGTSVLSLRFPDGTTVSGTVEPGEPVAVQMYGAPVASRAVDGPWAAALSEYASTPLRLLYAEPSAVDRVPEGGSVSLVSRGSLARLAAEADTPEPLDGRRFRMLFEVDGLLPHEEDTWLGSDVAIGDAVIRVNGDIGRCVVTSHDPDTGVTTVDTLGALARYRREGVVEPLPFGVYGSVVSPGRVAVGDAVELLDA
jgi:uncharacterized protein YcbX